MTWPPEKENARGAEGVENNKKRSVCIIHFPLQVRNCCRCGTHFRPRQRHHDLCSSCYAWSVHADATAHAMAALREVR